MSKRHIVIDQDLTPGFAEAAATSVSKRGWRARAIDRVRAYDESEDAATTIEFAILALPFCLLMFSILELAVIFFISAALDHGTSQATREIRTGELQSSETSKSAQLTKFRDMICEEMANLADCKTKLRVDIVSDDTFSTATLPASSRDMFAKRPGDDYEKNPDGTYKKDADGKRIRKEAPKPPTSNYNCSAPRKVVLVRTEFYHDLTLPRRLTFLGNDPDGWNRRILTSTTAFRNEPFPATAGANCA